VQARLLDINEIFFGSGVGRTAYSIVEQGRIGQIVSARPEDRRSIIEEAAGITKYKKRREAAERKMEATHQNLTRVADIVQELGKQLEALNRQARRAEKYKTLKAEIRELELRAAAARYLELTATRRMADHLVRPLLEKLGRTLPDWQMTTFLSGEATKARLAELLGGSETPALLFTTSHGLGFPCGDARQRPHQGALLCGDWPGPESWKAAIPQDFYFAGDDLAADASLRGLISFHFACYGAGTPRLDDFAQRALKDRAAIAPEAFLGALPQALLSHPRCGALAVIGHVERAWGYSFLWKGAGAQTVAFESALRRLLDGHPVGSAMEYFNARYAELSTMLADRLDEMELGAKPDPAELAGLWTANNDARGYVILGDPAVRLPVAGSRGIPAEEPVSRSIPMSADPGADPFSVSVRPEPAVREKDAVQISAWHPRALAVEETAKLLVYAHLLSAAGAVSPDAGQILGKAAAGYREAEASSAAAIAPGTEILVVPEGEGLLFDPPQARLTWSGAWQRADFSMRATGDRAGHVVEGSIACYAGPLLIANVRLPVVVLRPGARPRKREEKGPALQSARLYQAIFASYAHADTPVVEAMEKACKALGMDYLRDVINLKAGQRWSDELLRMIERADVFQLFWSTPASQSAYVEQEWRHALGLGRRKGEAFIRPIYWEKPLPPVPEPLRSLHFAPVDLPGLATVPQATSPAVPPLPARLLSGEESHDLTTLTVSTWAAADPGDPAASRLKARTRISLTGDVETHHSADPADAHHLDLHEKMVAEALKARIAYLELLGRGKG